MTHMPNRHTQTTTMTTIDFTDANKYIESNTVRTLNVSGLEVHDKLWPTFKQLLLITPYIAYDWKYESSFKYALDSVTNECKVTNSHILEDKALQLKIGFNFIMHLYH